MEVKKKNIVVLCGGDSTEREISLKSGKMIFKNIDRNKYNARVLDTKNDLKKLSNLAKKKKIDLAFIALHGKGGEDGTIQRYLENLKIKYTGSEPLASAIAMNKEITRNLLRTHKIRVPKFKIIKRGDNNYKLLKYPFVVKPVNHGSSIAVKIVRNKKEFEKSLTEIFKIDDEAIIEEYIKGTEITVAIIGSNKSLKALPVVEIVPKGRDFFDYKAKYQGKSEEIVPAKSINNKIAQKAQDIAVNVHKIVGCKDMSRTDMIINNVKIFVLEINTIPGMTKDSILPKAAKANGMDFKNLVEFFINLGFQNG